MPCTAASMRTRDGSSGRFSCPPRRSRPRSSTASSAPARPRHPRPRTPLSEAARPGRDVNQKEDEMRKRTTLTAVVLGALTVAGAGTGLAASGGSGSSSFLDSLAKHLGVSREKLDEATKAAAKDQV